MFKYTSKEFNKISQMINEKKILTVEICKYFNLDRSNFRLQQGSITLQGLHDNKWFNLTSTIGDFPTKIKENNYKSFRLSTRLQNLIN